MITINSCAVALSFVVTAGSHVIAGTVGSGCPSAVLDSSDVSFGSIFGGEVDLSGPVAIVGAENDDEGGESAGAAIIFRLTGSSWVEETKLLPADVEPGASFGAAVAVDGNVAVIGAPDQSDQGEDAGAAWVFRYDGAAWIDEGRLLTGKTGPASFGRAVDIQNDLAVIGSSANAAFVFRYDPIREEWSLEATLQVDAGAFGSTVALDGDRVLVGAWVDRAAYVFRNQGAGVWVEEAVLQPADTSDFSFSRSLALCADIAVVSAAADEDVAFNSGAAYVYRRRGTSWSQEVKLRPPAGVDNQNFGRSVATTSNTILVGAPTTFDPGFAYLFRWNGTAWALEHQLAGNSGDWNLFGDAVSIDAQTALVGSPFDNAAFVFDLDELAVDCEGGTGGCVSDCNGNGNPDICDIADGLATDCNENQVPDACELDCNENGVPDDCDLSAGTSVDCNGNGVPDDCEPDCNGNMIADACDIASGSSVDCDLNGVPDECEPDCNENGIVDACDITAGLDTDCNGNSVLDGCDLEAGSVEDCNANAVPDSCELSDYQVDDGTIELQIGFLNGGDLIWLNQFNVQPGAETIRFVSVLWPAYLEGDLPATVLLYDDPNNDGDPADAALLATAPIISVGPGSDSYVVVAVPDTLVGEPGDSFFAGVFMTTDDYPIGGDESSTYQVRSWIAAAAPGEGDIDDLTNNAFPIQRISFDVNFTIRADAQPPAGVPHACAVSGDANADGVVDVNDLLAVILNWGACSPPPLVLCPGDLDGNGVVGVADLVTVLVGWTVR